MEETTAATGEIVTAAASTQLVTSDLKAQIKYGGADRLFDEIRVNVSYIVEACSFHDITSEGRAKVVRAINAIEGAWNSLVIIVGEDATAALTTVNRAIDRIDDGIKLEGPQPKEGLSQDEVDKICD